MQRHGSKYFARIPPPPPPPTPPGPQVETQLFQNMVMLHIELTGITKCSNIGANVLPADLPHYPRGWGQKVKIQLYQNMVMLHIKFIGIMKCSNIVANILPEVNRSKINFFKTWSCYTIELSQNVATWYQIYFAHRPPPPLTLVVKRSKFNFFFQNNIMLHIK